MHGQASDRYETKYTWLVAEELYHVVAPTYEIKVSSGRALLFRPSVALSFIVEDSSGGSLAAEELIFKVYARCLCFYVFCSSWTTTLIFEHHYFLSGRWRLHSFMALRTFF